MKLPILVVCLVVLYGTCVYAEENVNLINKIKNVRNYRTDYLNVALGKSLVRRRRDVISSLEEIPITLCYLMKNILDRFGIPDNGWLQDVCSSIGTDITLVPFMIRNFIGAILYIIYQIFSTSTSQVREIIGIIITIFFQLWQIFKSIMFSI